MDVGNTKTSREAFKFYQRWQKALLADRRKLPRGHTRIGLVAYCLVMAVHGTNGIRCYAGDDVIREELGIYNRRDILKYRKLAMNLGWFVEAGERKGRKEVLNISIPTLTPLIADAPPVEEPLTMPAVDKACDSPEVEPPAVEHDVWATGINDCPGCKQLVADGMDVEMAEQQHNTA